nr:hypothetical protein [Tanacetum cinerariifolium]
MKSCVSWDHNLSRLTGYNHVGLTFLQLGELFKGWLLAKTRDKGIVRVGGKDSAQSSALSGLTLTFPGLTFVDLGL